MKGMRKLVRNVMILLLVGTFGIVLFFLLHRQIARLYCRLEVDFKLYMYTQSVKKNGAPIEMELNESVKIKLSDLFNRCLSQKG